MNRRGIALIAALWLLALLSVVATGAVGTARVAMRAASYRSNLESARWASSACLARLLTKGTGDFTRFRDSIALSSGVSCVLQVEPEGVLLNVNHAPEEMIAAYLNDRALSDPLLDWRDPDDIPRGQGAERDWYTAQGRAGPRNGPLRSPREVALVRGFEAVPLAELETQFDIGISARISAPYAPPRLLHATGLFPVDAGFASAAAWAGAGRRLESMEALNATLSPAGQELLQARWDEAVRMLTFSRGDYRVTAVGVSGSGAVRHVLEARGRLSDSRIILGEVHGD